MSENADLSALNESEANEADVQGQSEDVTEVEAPSRTDAMDVDEFDAAEQSRAVDLDPDEYR